ncbi:transketolase-like [Diabrotica undecimpunctata]|uniref:transketolase-like n=1 Tax=Diabrotica undecimpunctata TaxID=50387 RepID=UPI003B638876
MDQGLQNGCIQNQLDEICSTEDKNKVTGYIENIAKTQKRIKMSETSVQNLKNIAIKIRISSVETTAAAKSGHPTTCSSCAEILSVLFFRIMRYKACSPREPCNDRFVMSKGHAAPALYAVWAEIGLIPTEELLNLRKIDSDLEGHPTPRLSFIDVGTGSLGQGLAVASGMAYIGKYIEEASYRVYCLLGDGECAEGSIWESINFASFYKLDNLCAIIDVNRLGQAGPTMFGHDVEKYQKRLDAFGFHTIVINGHEVEELISAFESADKIKDKPTAIIAKTIKGKDFPGIENEDNWHGKPLGDKTEAVLQHLRTMLPPDINTFDFNISQPLSKVKAVNINNIFLSKLPDYTKGDKVATRNAYGNGLLKLAETNPRVIAFDGDMRNSTFSEYLLKAKPKNFVECFIAEQNMIGVATGACTRNRCVAFASTFAAFLTRAFDQIRMAAISQSNINICGSHCGISIGPDGPSQMGLEDLALFRAIPTCTVFYPSDAVAAERAVELAANTKGITYIRTTRSATPVIYDNNQIFKIGKANILLESRADKVLVIAACITLVETLEAAKLLTASGIYIRVMDPFTIKPIDKNGIIKHAKEVNGRILVVEDHYAEGGIGEAVLSAVAEENDITVKIAAIKEVPRSGDTTALLDFYGIDSVSIVGYVQDILRGRC